MSAKESALSLRRSNFTFGNDSVKFETTYQNRFDKGIDEDYYKNTK